MMTKVKSRVWNVLTWLNANTLLLLGHLLVQGNTLNQINHNITCCTFPYSQHRQSCCPPRSAPWLRDSDWQEQCPALPCRWTYNNHTVMELQYVLAPMEPWSFSWLRRHTTHQEQLTAWLSQRQISTQTSLCSTPRSSLHPTVLKLPTSLPKTLATSTSRQCFRKWNLVLRTWGQKLFNGEKKDFWVKKGPKMDPL